jgi:hypothetical protein
MLIESTFSCTDDNMPNYSASPNLAVYLYDKNVANLHVKCKLSLEKKHKKVIIFHVSTFPAYFSKCGPYIVVTPELRIDGVCCVGLSSHGTLLLHNPYSRWQCISLCVTQFSIDGRAEDQSICPFNVRPKVTVDPNSVESVKVQVFFLIVWTFWLNRFFMCNRLRLL